MRTAGSNKSFRAGRRRGSAEAWTEKSAADDRSGPATISGSGRGSFFHEARVITTTTTTTTTTTRKGAAGGANTAAAASGVEAVPPGFQDAAEEADGVETGIGDDEGSEDDEDDSMADLSAMLREANAATPRRGGAQRPSPPAAGRGSGGSHGSSHGTLDPAEGVAAASRR